MNTRKYCKWMPRSVLTLMVSTVVSAGITWPVSIQAAPAKAKGQIFQLVENLDTRVDVIEAALAENRHVSVDKHGFQPNANVYFVNDTSLGAFSQSYTPLRASVSFPDDAVITQLTCFFYDADPINDLACRLGRTEFATGESEYIGEVLSEKDAHQDPADPHVAKALILPEGEIVDNVDYGYFVEVRPDDNDPIDPYDNDEWGFGGLQDDTSGGLQNDPPANPLTFIKGVRVTYH